MRPLTTRSRLYWTLQIGGWALYRLFGGILVSTFGKFSVTIIPIEVIVAGTLVLMGHLLRLYVRRHGWA